MAQQGEDINGEGNGFKRDVKCRGDNLAPADKLSVIQHDWFYLTVIWSCNSPAQLKKPKQNTQKTRFTDFTPT